MIRLCIALLSVGLVMAAPASNSSKKALETQLRDMMDKNPEVRDLFKTWWYSYQGQQGGSMYHGNQGFGGYPMDWYRRKFLDAHNNARRSVRPTASNMQRMRWDNRLAQNAQERANQCMWERGYEGRWSHEEWKRRGTSYPFVGENMFVFRDGFHTSMPFEMLWENERNRYNYESNSCDGRYGDNEMNGSDYNGYGDQERNRYDYERNSWYGNNRCGRYKQLVWAHWQYLGCGFNRCNSLRGLPWTNQVNEDVMFVVCHYAPNERPYMQGTPCSSCQYGDQDCSQGQGLCSWSDYNNGFDSYNGDRNGFGSYNGDSNGFGSYNGDRNGFGPNNGDSNGFGSFNGMK